MSGGGATRQGRRAERVAVVSCPFLKRVTGAVAQTFPSGYNCQLRRGRDRAPSVDELAWFCTNGRYRACPTYMAGNGRRA